MNWHDVLTAMLPENLLLAGIAAAARREITTGRERDGFFDRVPHCCRRDLCRRVALCAAATRARRSPAISRRASALAAEGGPARVRAAGPAGLERRLRRDALLRAAAGVAVRRVPADSSDSFLDAVPRPRDHVAAGVRAGAARLPAPREHRGGAQVPGARRRGDGDPAHGRVAALRLRAARSISRRSARRSARPTARRRRRRAGRRGTLPEGRDRAVPCLGARCLRGRERAGHRLHGHRVKAGVLFAALRLFGTAPCRVRWRRCSPSCRSSRWPGATSPPSAR